MNTVLDIALTNALLAAGLAVLAYAVGCLIRRPALLHALWLLVLLKLITPPLVSVPLPVVVASQPAEPELAAETTPKAADLVFEPAWAPVDPEPAAPLAASELHATGDIASAAALPVPETLETEHSPPTVGEHVAAVQIWWRPVLAGVWLTGTLVWLVIAGIRIARFRHFLGMAKPAPQYLQRQALDVAGRLGLARVPQVRLVPGPVSPMLWAFGGPPCLLLPAGLLDRLSAQQTATLLAHELAHLRRRDHWLRGLELLATALYWWNPVLWWTRRELREAEEQCCDAWVVWALPAAARDYALALVETVDFLSPARPALPPAASGVGHFHILNRRLHMIVRGNTPKALSRWGILAVIGLAALSLPLLPTWAQAPPPRERDVPKDPRPVNPIVERERAEAVEKAHAEIREMHRVIEKMQLELELAHRRLRQAQERLEQLEGRRPDERGRRYDDPGRPGDRYDGRGGRGGAGGVGGSGPSGRDIPKVPEGRDGNVERRMMDLERRMDGLIREMQALRSELRGRGRGPDDRPPEPRPGAAPGDRKPAPPPPGDDRRRPPRDEREQPPTDAPPK